MAVRKHLNQSGPIPSQSVSPELDINCLLMKAFAPTTNIFMKRISTLFSLNILLPVVLSLVSLANPARCQDVERPTVLSAVFDNGNTEIRHLQ